MDRSSFMHPLHGPPPCSVLALDLCKRVLRQAAGEEGEQRFNATHTDLAQVCGRVTSRPMA